MVRIRGQRFAVTRRRVVSPDDGSPHADTNPPYRYDALYPATTQCRTPAAGRRSATAACIGVRRSGVPRRRSVSRGGGLPYLYDEPPYRDGRLYPRTTRRRIATALGAGVRRLVVAGYSSSSQYDVSSSADTARRRWTVSRHRGRTDHRTRIQLAILVRRFVVRGYRRSSRYGGSPYAYTSRCRGTAARCRGTTDRRRRIQLAAAGYNSPPRYGVTLSGGYRPSYRDGYRPAAYGDPPSTYDEPASRRQLQDDRSDVTRGNRNALRGIGVRYRLSVTSPTRLKPASLRTASTSETLS